ncbi:MAG: ABC transporter substrate-binding protein [Acidobacteriota bacterium]|nr:ABC transporter substrate-binding protein [Acidobacteriota bacterium]
MLLAGLLAVTVGTGCNEAPVSSKPTQPAIRTIPAILPLTGPSADLGRSVEQGMRLAEEDFSTAGKPYRLKVEDSQGKPETALTAYNALHAALQSGLVLSWMSSAGRALAPVTRAEGRLLFVGAALSDLTSADGKVVRVWPNAVQIGETMGTFASGKGYKRIAVLHVNDDYGRSVAAAFARVFERSSGRVVAREPLDPAQTDYRTPAERIQRLQPDAIYMPAYGGAYTNGLRQLREVFGKEIPIIADFTLLSSFTLPQVGAAAEGVLVPATYLDLEPHPTEPARAFAERYKAKYGMEADFNAGLGYMMLQIAAQALDAHPDGADLASAIRGRTFQGPIGDLRYDTRNDCTLPIVIARIAGGRARKIS